MASSQDYETGIYGGGRWNPGRNHFPPCSVSVSDYMWLESSLNNMDEKNEMNNTRGAASYSRSDDSSADDYHSSSSDQHLHVISSGDYAQTFQHGHMPHVVDFSSSDWSSENSLLLDSVNMSIFMPTTDSQKNNHCNHEFYNQETSLFGATTNEFQLGLENSNSTYRHPATIQTTLAGPDADLSYVLGNNNFAPNNWPKLLLSPKQLLNGGTKQTNTNNSVPLWDSWMSNDIDSQQLLAVPALMEDQKPCKYGNPTGGISLPKIGSNNTILARKVASSGPAALLGAKRKNNTSDELYKKPRFEAPSSLPTFKVRKEKLGDRITALQQLVSPFGKTDTASVLQEAIEYIKFLHDQVSVLRTPYMQTETSTNQGESKNNGGLENPKQDLKSRGLCLVPISSTFPVASETTADFWTPTFGGTMTFR